MLKIELIEFSVKMIKLENNIFSKKRNTNKNNAFLFVIEYIIISILH